MVEDAAAPAGRGEQAHEDLEEGRFAGPVEPEQADPPRLEAQRQVTERVVGPVPALDVVQFDQCWFLRLKSSPERSRRPEGLNDGTWAAGGFEGPPTEMLDSEAALR